MKRRITTLILTFLTVTSYGQRTLLFKPFIDDHKVFTYNDKNLGFINLDKYDNAWKFTIEQFNSETLTVKQISDSLLASCKDSTALTILKTWNKLSVDTISIKQTDDLYDLTIGNNNIYNEDKGVSAIIYFNIVLQYDNKTKKNIVTRIKYLTTKKYDD